MTRTALALCAFLVASPALAEECRYVSGFDRGNVKFIEEQGDPRVRFEWAHGDVEVCDYLIGDEGGNQINCPDGTTYQWSFAGLTLGSNEPALFVMDSEVWYRQCYEPA